MNTTHVFIVDTTTFKYHLEYQFAGTGAKDSYIDFNQNPRTNLNAQAENNLVSMVADSQRVRRGDFVIFYLQQNYSQKIFDGKFYGIFKIKESPSFLDNNDNNQFLKDELEKSLTFRTIIEPFEVYPKGVTEWEALDEIKFIQSPYQMLWSLIYRKLKGIRGNTMITIYESERLFKLIRDKNQRQPLDCSNFTFNIHSQEVQPSASLSVYSGRKERVDILPRLIQKCREGKLFEVHLQAYIVQNIGKGLIPALDDMLIGRFNSEWIGNEVSCGVGMQRIDVMLSITKDSTRVVIPMELKTTKLKPAHLVQLQRYVDWLEQYYIPNRISDIQPVLIALKSLDKTILSYQEAILGIQKFNLRNKRCLPLKYIEFRVIDGALNFTETSY